MVIRIRSSRKVINNLAAKGLGQILGLQKISKKTSPVYRYYVGFCGVGLPEIPVAVLAATDFNCFINSAIALCKFLAASGVKSKDIDPSTRFKVSLEVDIINK